VFLLGMASDQTEIVC